MKAYESSARINAAPERVWSVLSDGAGWADWESGVERVEGRIAESAKLPDLQPSFDKFATGLKHKVESET
jgi:hypothetical protein